MPGRDSFLGVFPLAHDRIAKPRAREAVNLQIEPEAAVLCAVDYLSDTVTRLAPTAIGAFNDCTIRRPGASKPCPSYTSPSPRARTRPPLPSSA